MRLGRPDHIARRLRRPACGGPPPPGSRFGGRDRRAL